MQILPRSCVALIWLILAASLCVGILGRGYWTPDEPREADLAWRMSWQPSKAVPLLAGEAFCEKPPLTYWLAGAAIGAGGSDAWVARLPNLLYALITALAVAMIARRGAGPIAGIAAAAAISTFLLSYQVAIWLATDAPLVAAVAAALLGLHVGFYARATAERLRGYSCMHLALAAGFLSKSAAAWMVPALTFATLVIWERRWRELLRWELYVGLLLQAALILAWVWVVYAGPDGPSRLKVFFWNNLVGRFTQVDAPGDLQYAAGHRNTPANTSLNCPSTYCLGLCWSQPPQGGRGASAPCRMSGSKRTGLRWPPSFRPYASCRWRRRLATYTWLPPCPVRRSCSRGGWVSFRAHRIPGMRAPCEARRFY